MKSLRFMTPDFVLQGELESYTSLQLIRRHYGTGDFALHFHGNTGLLRTIRVDSRIFSPEAPEKMMVVESIQYKEAERQWVLKGPMLDGLVRRRICVPPGDSAGTFGWDRVVSDAETVFQHYMANHMVHPEHAPRAMPDMVMAANQHRGMGNVPWQARFDPLEEVLEELGEYADMGWDIRPDYGAKRYVFDVRPGRNLAVGNESGSAVILSLKMGNASEMTHAWDASALRNTAYVGGEGEDEQRFIQTVGGSHAGLSRRELWVDAGSASELTDLRMSGEKKLTDATVKESIQATVQFGGAFRYGRDWDLGDRVTFQMQTGRMDARIIEVKETYERGNPVKLGIKAGEGPITLQAAIKRMTNGVAR